MREDEVTAFLTNLARERNVSASTQNQALCALVFLYKHVLGKPLGEMKDLVWAKRRRRSPVVLTRDEVRLLLQQLEGVHWLILTLLYGTGMRLLEALRLRVKDVDFAANQITVRDGKGGKDRVTMLPAIVQPGIRSQLEVSRKLHLMDLRDGFGRVSLPYALDRKYPSAAKQWAWQYIFPSHKRSKDPRSENVIYTHVLNRGGLGIKSPADLI